MGINFHYGISKMKEVRPIINSKGGVDKLVLPTSNGTIEAKPTKRMWQSWRKRFKLDMKMFKIFTHSEVFERISKIYPNDKIRWAVEELTDADGNKFPKRVSGISDPHKTPLIQMNTLFDILEKHKTEETAPSYANGVIRSRHIPRNNPAFEINGDLFENRFYIDTPIDGVGKPMAYVGLLREVCVNGVIGYSPAFRSEITVGKKNDSTEFALERMMDTFNNPDGFTGIREMFELAAVSWASVNEAVRLNNVILKVHQLSNLKKEAGKLIIGSSTSDNAIETGATPIMAKFMELTGNMNKIYNTSNIDTIPLKKQRLLPAGCKVYDILNFASEVATRYTLPAGGRIIQAYIGKLISQEYDLAGTAANNESYRDLFFKEGTADVMASLT